MNVPKGQEKFATAELFIELPGDWKYKTAKDLADPQYSWPFHWLRRVANHPVANRTWLGGPVAFFTNDEAPKPLAPNSKFSALMLFAEKSFAADGGQTVQLYRVTPIYAQERDYALINGIPALLEAFDRKKISYVVDPKRPCAV